MERLRAGARELGLDLSAQQLERFEHYYTELVSANRRTNLTRIIAYEDVQVRHFLDSLSCWLALRDGPLWERAIDVGSGAGFPGIPLKIVFPEPRLTLLDSVGKRTAFLCHMVQTLALDGVSVLTARAEDGARQSGHRAAYDLVLARAVAPLPVVLELCLPYLRQGGRLVAPRRGDLEGEIRSARVALDALGGDARLVPVQVSTLQDGRALVVVDKIGPTPERYPRRAGLPAEHPLGTS